MLKRNHKCLSNACSSLSLKWLTKSGRINFTLKTLVKKVHKEWWALPRNDEQCLKGLKYTSNLICIFKRTKKVIHNVWKPLGFLMKISKNQKRPKEMKERNFKKAFDFKSYVQPILNKNLVIRKSYLVSFFASPYTSLKSLLWWERIECTFVVITLKTLTK